MRSCARCWGGVRRWISSGVCSSPTTRRRSRNGARGRKRRTREPRSLFMPDAMNLAYLPSAYGRASDSFIRGEVAQLRAMGHTVHTFSVRRPSESGDCGEQVEQERAFTKYITETGAVGLL